MFGLGLDEQLGSSQSMRSEATDQLIGKPYGNKGQGVSPVGASAHVLAVQRVNGFTTVGN